MYYLELFKLLNEKKVKYLVVGGLALVLHGIIRLTADIDLMVDLTKDNLAKLFDVMKSLDFVPKMPVKMEDFADQDIRKTWAKEKSMVMFSLINKKDDYKIIDIFTENPIEFNGAYSRKQIKRAEGVDVDVISFDDLIQIKKLSARAQDLEDIKMLEDMKNER